MFHVDCKLNSVIYKSPIEFRLKVPCFCKFYVSYKSPIELGHKVLCGKFSLLFSNLLYRIMFQRSM